MDYLPIQATSVPCERIFSSAKETDTRKRNRMSPLLMEALQLLKFTLKKERLNFTEGWVTSEETLLAVPKPTYSLNSLSKGNPDVVLDKILKEFLQDDDN
jgi:hypothetical protein